MVRTRRSRRRWSPLVITALVGLGTLGLASTSQAASRPPAVIMAWSSNNTQLINNPEVWGGAQAAARALNRRGGIRGQRIKIVTCNSQANLDATKSCARKAVSQHVLAVIGPVESFLDGPVEILRKAGIPFLGSGAIPNEQTAANSFPITGGPIPMLGIAVFYLASRGVTQFGITAPQVPAPAAVAEQLAPVIDKAGNYTGFQSFPVTTQTLAPVVQQLQSAGARAVLAITGGPLTPALEQTAKAINYKPTWATTAAGTPPSDAKKNAAVLEGTLIGSFFPPATSDLPGIKRFNADAAAAAKAGIANTGNRDDTMVQAWADVYGLTKVARTLTTGTVTTKKLYRALRKAKNINIEGLVKWSPGSRGPAKTPRLTNGAAYLSVIKNGAYKLLTPKPIDVFARAGLK
jgi:ABC-type branched-subunit amino acid transport system substrate-binding protein